MASYTTPWDTIAAGTKVHSTLYPITLPTKVATISLGAGQG